MTNKLMKIVKGGIIAGLVYTGVFWNPERAEQKGKESFLESKIESAISKVSKEDFDLNDKDRKTIKYSSLGLLLGLGAIATKKYNDRMMRPVRYEIGFGELGKMGYRERYPTAYWAKWDKDWKFNYEWDLEDIFGSSLKNKIEKKIKFFWDGKYIIYDEWDTHEEYHKEDSFFKDGKELLKKAKIGKNKFYRDNSIKHFN